MTLNLEQNNIFLVSVRNNKKRICLIPGELYEFNGIVMYLGRLKQDPYTDLYYFLSDGEIISYFKFTVESFLSLIEESPR